MGGVSPGIQVEDNYNETKINQCAQPEELLPQHMVTDVLRR